MDVVKNKLTISSTIFPLLRFKIFQNVLYLSIAPPPHLVHSVFDSTPNESPWNANQAHVHSGPKLIGAVCHCLAAEGQIISMTLYLTLHLQNRNTTFYLIRLYVLQSK